VPEDRGRTVAFGHVGVQVSDLERSRTYYRDVIGLTEIEHLVRDEPYLEQVTGYPGVTLAISLLREPSSGTILEVLEYRGVERTPIDPATANPGTGHMCFVVDDVDAVYARALAAGHGAVNPPVTPTAGRWIGGRIVYLLDPDGFRVELVQPGPAAVTQATRSHKEVPMARVAWTGRLRPDKIDEYEAAHAAVWPEMLQMIRDAGVRNYSIYRFGDRVFGYYECDDAEAAIAYQAAAEVTTRWNAWMSQLFDPEVAENGPDYLPEIFRLD
jgi:lactoylglutathione lyase